MENRFIRQNLIIKKAIDYVDVAPRHSRKRPGEPITQQTKKVKTNELPKFNISYEKPHSPLILHNSRISNRSFIIQEDIEEYSIDLARYRKTVTFKQFSYIEATNEVESLLKYYEATHKALKPTKKSRQLQPNGSNMSKLQQTNTLISLAKPFLNSNFKLKIISKLYGVKYKQLYDVQQKQKKNQNALLESRGRKTKIKTEYLDFLNRYFQDQTNCFTSLRQLKLLLQDKFHLNDYDLSLTTIFRMVKSQKFFYKRVTRAPIRRNIDQAKEDRYSLIMEILRHVQLERTFIYIDESGFGNYTIPNYAYAKNSSRCIYNVEKRTENLSLIAAMTQDRILGFQVIKGSVTAKDFGAFLVSLINSTQLVNDGLDKYVFFMDNARIHHAKIIKG